MLISKACAVPVLVVLALVASVGCKPKAAWETTYPTSGKVTFKGRPVKGAEIAFFPTDTSFPESVRPQAKSKEDGSFEVWTYKQGDGAPVGSYKVTLVHNEVTVSKDTVVAKPNDLPVKYSRRDSTNLEVKITAGKNDLPTFELK